MMDELKEKAVRIADDQKNYRFFYHFFLSYSVCSDSNRR